MDTTVAAINIVKSHIFGLLVRDCVELIMLTFAYPEKEYTQFQHLREVYVLRL